VTIQDFLTLLPELTKARVKRFKLSDLEIEFHVEQEAGLSTGEVIKALKKQEEQLPVDLRTDNITSYDAVLNWSGSPDPQELPLTGDQPL
jgi:hypothetical protein